MVIATPPVSNSFFSTLEPAIKGVSEGFGETARTVLPVWFSRQLLDQQESQLTRPTFDPATAPPTLNAAATTGGFRNAFLDMQTGGISVSGFTVVLIAAAVIGGFLIIRRLT